MKAEIETIDDEVVVKINTENKTENYDQALLLIKNLSNAIEITKAGRRIEYEKKAKPIDIETEEF